MQRGMSTSVMLGPGIGFACVVLSGGVPAFTRNVNLGHGVVVVSQSPFLPDASWTRMLGTVFGEAVAKSKCILVATAPAPVAIGAVTSGLRQTAALAYGALALACGPAGGPTYTITGSNSGNAPTVSKVGLFPVYLHAAGSRTCKWTPSLIKSSTSVFDGMVDADGAGNASRRLRRGINALLSALSSTVLQDRLHGHVRALEALLDVPQYKGSKEFAKRMQSLCSCRSHSAETFEGLYILRNKIEHMCDPEEAFPSLSDDQFKAYIEAQTRLAERASLGVYRRVLAKPSLRAIFGDVSRLDSFWASTGPDRQHLWGKTVYVDGRRG